MTRELPIYLGEPVTHTIADLEAQALKFLKDRKMSPKDRSDLAKLKAKAAKRYAENMIEQGTPDFVAWPMAIRSQILETESD